MASGTACTTLGWPRSPPRPSLVPLKWELNVSSFPDEDLAVPPKLSRPAGPARPSRRPWGPEQTAHDPLMSGSPSHSRLCPAPRCLLPCPAPGFPRQLPPAGPASPRCPRRRCGGGEERVGGGQEKLVRAPPHFPGLCIRRGDAGHAEQASRGPPLTCPRGTGSRLRRHPPSHHAPRRARRGDHASSPRRGRWRRTPGPPRGSGAAPASPSSQAPPARPHPGLSPLQVHPPASVPTLPTPARRRPPSAGSPVPARRGGGARRGPSG